MLKVPTEGELQIGDYLADQFNSGDVSIGLFISNHTPADGDTLATYTAIEATFPGYAPIVTSGWLPAATDGSGRAFTQADFAVFNRTAGAGTEDVYGYFVWDTAAGKLLWAELDPMGPVTINTDGQTYAVRPRLTDRSEA